jgi:glycosyltransferase involved in cell wall biosynthesis
LRIGFIGNQNNFPFMLARALRRLGHDIRMVIDQEHPLDRPEYRYADVSYPYPDWIREIPSVQMEDVVFNTARWQAALDVVRDCDALVLNKFGYDAANRLPLPAFCLTTGGDVEFWANPRSAEAFACHVDRYERPRDWARAAMRMERLDWPSLKEILDQAPRPLYRTAYKQLFRLFVRRQRAGLRRAVGFSGLPDGVSAAMTEVMRACRLPGVPRLHLLMADVDWIVPQPAPENAVLRVFNSARILWQLPFPPLVGEWENKGTDVFLKGAAIWHRRAGQAIDIRLVEKGLSVGATKALVRDLDIQHLVHWQPELTQAQVFEEYNRADIVADQCGCHVVSMGGFEAMAAGRPVIANGRPDLYASFPSGPPPVAQAATPEEVAIQLDRLSRSTERHRLAVEGRRFVERYVSVDDAARQVAAILGDAVAAQPRPAARLAA